MVKKLTISAKDEKVPFLAAVRGSKTPVLKLCNNFNPLLTIWSFFLQVLTNSPFQFLLTIIINRSSSEKYSQLLEFRLGDRVLKKVTQA